MSNNSSNLYNILFVAPSSSSMIPRKNSKKIIRGTTKGVPFHKSKTNPVHPLKRSHDAMTRLAATSSSQLNASWNNDLTSLKRNSTHIGLGGSSSSQQQQQQSQSPPPTPRSRTTKLQQDRLFLNKNNKRSQETPNNKNEDASSFTIGASKAVDQQHYSPRRNERFEEGISELLALLRSGDFVGRVDPEYHASYVSKTLEHAHCEAGNADRQEKSRRASQERIPYSQ